jgi:hypothetical protein
MNALEDRLRAALQAHAETFAAHPDAWRRLQARRRAGAGRRLFRRWPTWLGPAAAAAAVFGVVAVAAAVTGGFGAHPAGSPGTPAPRATARPNPWAHLPPEFSRDAFGLVQQVPLTSPPLKLSVPSAGSVTTYFWLGHAGTAVWSDQIIPGLALCHDATYPTQGASGDCIALPRLGAGQFAVTISNDGLPGTGKVLSGVAAARVTSVTAVLPDGRAFAGAVGTLPGVGEKAWIVDYPHASGVRLVFRDAAGREAGRLGTAAPLGPPQVPRPKHGGVRVYSYPAGGGEPAGEVDAYLVDGHVGFWSLLWGGMISGVPAAGPPALGGLTAPFGLTEGASWTRLQAFGYAHANVARVVLRLPDGRQVSASTTTGWPGLRLWTANVPLRGQAISDPRQVITATGYDASGHVVGRVQLGGMA